MKKLTPLRFLLIFITFIIPILGMMNCSGFNAGSMSVRSCLVDVPLFRDYANFYYSFLFISSFMIGVPIIIYVFIVGILYKYIPENNDKILPNNTNNRSDKDNIVSDVDDTIHEEEGRKATNNYLSNTQKLLIMIFWIILALSLVIFFLK